MSAAGADGGSGPPERTDATRRLAAFAAELDLDRIPAEVVEHTKTCLLDALGCGFLGSSLPWTRIALDALAGIDGSGSCVVLDSARTLGPAHAAAVNGAAIHAFEMDDLHPKSILHPSSVVLPAALAAAEHRGGVTGAQLLTAVVAGYEVGARVGMTMGAAHLLRGFHPTGTHGAVAAAAAAGSVLGLTPEQMAHALGIGATQSAGLMSAQFSSMVKRFHAGRAAQSGLYGAILAGAGYTGIVDVFDVEYGGYGSTLSSRYDKEPLTAGLGEVWETLSVGFKPYSTNGSCHPTIDALLEMRERTGLRADQVQEVRLRVSTATVEHVGWEYVPDSVTTAQMNLPYIVAVVLTDGAALAAQFSEERIRDPRLVELSRRVSVMADPAIDAEGDAGRHHTFVEVTTTDGAVHTDERRFARGSARQPLSAAEVEQKFDLLVEGILTTGRSAELKDVLGRLDGLTSLDPLLAVLRGAG